MKKIILITLIGVILITNISFSQGLFVKGNLGYGLAAGKEYINQNRTSGGGITTYEGVYTTYGKGLNFGGALGYMFSDHIGAELDVNYLLGSTITATEINGGGTEEWKYSASMLKLMPTVIFAVGGNGIDPYTRFGIVIGMLGNVKSEFTDIGGGSIEVRKYKDSGGAALGFTGTIGLNFSLSEALSLFGEVNLTTLTYAPTKGKLTEYTIDGVDQLGSLTPNLKEIEFVDNYTIDGALPTVTSKPTQELKIYYPFSSIGIRIGAMMNF